jgi:hypothetical protein
MSKKILSIVLVTSLVSLGQVQAGGWRDLLGLKDALVKAKEEAIVKVDVVETVEVVTPEAVVAGVVKSDTVEEEVVVDAQESTKSFFSATTESLSETITENRKASMVVAVSALIAAGYYLDEKYNLLDRAADCLGLNDKDENEDEDELDVV